MNKLLSFQLNNGTRSRSSKEQGACRAPAPAPLKNLGKNEKVGEKILDNGLRGGV